MKLLTNALFVIGIAINTGVFAAETNPEAVKKIASSNNQFAFDLYQEIIKSEKDKNIFISPFSISTALAMTYGGSVNETQQVMAKVLHFEENTRDFHLNYGAYLNQLYKNADKHIELAIANKIWIQKDFTFLEDFLNLNREAYGSAIEKADFINYPEDARQTINTYIAEKTQNRIKDLLPPETITKLTRMVLANAIYFKGDWKYEFDSTQTQVKNFTKLDQSSVKVPFMYQRSNFGYAENSDYKMINLPYKGDKQSMVIVLPHESNKLEQVESQINAERLASLTNYNRPEVDLYLPKFKLTLPLSLTKILKDLGMKEAFEPQADFSKMTGKKDLKISDVIHKAFIEIDEKGTEAAAATAVVMAVTTTAAAPDLSIPKIFNADHPFLFYIIDNNTKAILFMGKMIDPK